MHDLTDDARGTKPAWTQRPLIELKQHKVTNPGIPYYPFWAKRFYQVSSEEK